LTLTTISGDPTAAGCISSPLPLNWQLATDRLSFNPADVAGAASKVATQTVLLAAQIAGVPVKLSGTPDPQMSGAALATSSSNFAQTLATSAQVNEKVRAHRDALLRIAASILQERNIVASGTDADRKASLDVIKAIYASHAGRLPVTTN
jgi:MoxR-like ATPase